MRSIGLVLGACLLAVTGCGSSDPGGEPATLDEVKAAVAKTLSATFEHTELQVMRLGNEGSLKWTSTASVNAPAVNYKVTTVLTADPPSFGQAISGDPSVPVKDLTSEVHRVRDTMYLTMRSWPANLRGRWLPIPVAQAAETLASQGVQMTNDARTPSRLLAAVDIASATVSRTGTTFHMKVPAPDAVSILGAAALRMFAQRQLDVRSLTGGVPLTAVIDRQGRIESMRLDASDVTKQMLELTGTEVPSDSGLKTTIDLWVKNYGASIAVSAPSADRLIDPSEMAG